MKTRGLNKILGTLVILINLVFYIPRTWKIIASAGGTEGWGLLLLPLTFFFHLFIVTGAFGWLRAERLNSKPIKATLMAVLFLQGLFTIVNIFWVRTAIIGVIALEFFALISLTIYKKLKIEQTLLIANITGLFLMSMVKILLRI